jgi:hypothetical protein
MKMTSGTILMALTLGIFCGSGWVAAQETGVVGSGQGAPATVQSPVAVDNGAMPGDSHVRIVRLSDVKGMLALDRQTGHGFEQTMQNMPIVEGEKLRTADGYAEVEFEDNSTLRLAPESHVDFPLLALRSSGAKASTMRVVKGTVYANTESTKGNEFVLEAGQTKMTVAPSTRVRVEVNETRTVVSVFNGSVEVEHGGEATVVGKKESLTLEGGQTSVAKKVPESPYDTWDKESIDYHERYSKANSFAGSGNSFGLSDLNYYGSFINGGAGCGQMWQPYMVSAAWSPYSNGLWAQYPGAGYSWVSPYPWGWLPYHSGSWAFCQGVGWGWQPGGAWNGLNNIAGVGGQPVGAVAGRPVRSPLRPGMPQPPAAGTTKPSLVLANKTPLVISKEDRPGNFVFQRDSAGLGVPRGSLGNLHGISSHVERNGSANMEVYAAAPARGQMNANGSGHEMNRGPVTLRQGSPSGNWGGGGRGDVAASGARQGSNGSQGGGGYRGGGEAGGGGRSAGGGAAPSMPSGGGASAGGGGARGGASPK